MFSVRGRLAHDGFDCDCRHKLTLEGALPPANEVLEVLDCITADNEKPQALLGAAACRARLALSGPFPFFCIAATPVHGAFMGSWASVFVVLLSAAIRVALLANTVATGCRWLLCPMKKPPPTIGQGLWGDTVILKPPRRRDRYPTETCQPQVSGGGTGWVAGGVAGESLPVYS